MRLLTTLDDYDHASRWGRLHLILHTDDYLLLGLEMGPQGGSLLAGRARSSLAWLADRPESNLAGALPFRSRATSRWWKVETALPFWRNAVLHDFEK